MGIDGYKPRWLNGLAEIRAAHAARLRGLVGRTLTRSWVVWDPDDQSWWPDCPVVLDFDGEQLEISHQKFDDLSITWNTIDPTPDIAFTESGLVWRADTMEPVVGRRLRAVELLEWSGGDRDMANGMVALGLTFTDAHLTVYNAMDENGLSFDPPDDYIRHTLGE